MSIKKPIGAGLLVVAAGLLAMALMAPLASATRITPAATNIKATSTATTFLPENAFSSSSIQCKESSVTATTPSQVAPPGTENNTNRTGTGTKSAGPGSVIVDISPSPTFAKCALFVGGVEQVAATVATSGSWTLAHDFISKTAIPAAIGVPSNGATITIGTCVLTVSNGRGSAVMGRYTNGTNSTTAPSTLKVDGQIRFGDSPAGCSGFSTGNPAQFEANYSIRTNPEGATPVLVAE